MKPILIATISAVMLLGCEATEKHGVKQLNAPLSQRGSADEQRQRRITDQDLQAISGLHTAAEAGDLKAVKQFLKEGTDVDCIVGKASYRILHKAARAGHQEMVSYLIQQKASVNARAISGLTPLDLAIKKDHREIVQLLRENGGKTDFDLTDKTSVRWLKMCLDLYKADVGHFPTAKQGGLKALMKKPLFADKSLEEKWKGPYLKKEKAMFDDWGRKLNYEPTKREYQLYSSGPDGKSGTRDDLIYARSFDFLYELNSEEK